MDLTELTALYERLKIINDDANAKRADFKSRGENNLAEQAFGEVIGVGKCMAILVGDYPAEMNALTKG